MAVLTRGNRSIEWCSDGPDDGPLVVYFHGTPSGMRLDWPLDALVSAGARVVGFARPGFRTSTRVAGRKVAAAAGDTQALLTELDRDEFVALGWSGGGPSALAGAALLPACTRAVIVAGVAPLAGFDWRDGQAESNVEQFEAAIEGEAALRTTVDPAAEVYRTMSGDMIASDPNNLFGSADSTFLQQPAEAERMAASIRSAMEYGTDGFIDDMVSMCGDWGFDLTGMSVPITIFHGDEDRMVPPGHGRRLAELIPGADLRLVAGEGHISVMAHQAADIVIAVLPT